MSFFTFPCPPYPSDLYASPLVYIREASILNRNNYRGYMVTTTDDNRSLCFVFRNEEMSNIVYLNMTVDLCCGHAGDWSGPDGGCGINTNNHVRANVFNCVSFIILLILTLLFNKTFQF